MKSSFLLKFSIIVLGIVIILGAAFLGVYLGCEIKSVHIEGNELHEDEEIKKVILNDDYSWNSVYVYLKYKFKKPERYPFVDTMEISLDSPTELTIKVYEKNVIGYIYVDKTGQYAYIDKDGIVEELSTRMIEGVARIEGLSVEEVTRFEPLPVDNTTLFKKFLSLTQTLQKYHLMPDCVWVQENKRFRLCYEDVIVEFGQANHLNDKVVRLEKILPQLEGLKGTLHLDEWQNESSEITFEKEKKN